MRSIKIIFLSLILLYGNSVMRAQSNLLAPVYPGAVMSPQRGDKTQLVFLSKDPVEKVKSFYSAKIGKLTSDDPIANSFYLVNLGNTPTVSYAKTLKTANQISRQEGYPDPDAKNIGVLVIKKKPDNEISTGAGAENDNSSAGNSAAENDMMKKMQQLQKQMMKEGAEMEYSGQDAVISGMSKLFDGLKNEIFMQHHTKKELIGVYKKYKFLDTSFYFLSKDKNGDLVSNADKLLEQYKSKIRNSNPMNDHWNYWLGFLNKLADHAYSTCIVINKKWGSWKQ